VTVNMPSREEVNARLQRFVDEHNARAAHDALDEIVGRLTDLSEYVHDLNKLNLVDADADEGDDAFSIDPDYLTMVDGACSAWRTEMPLPLADLEMVVRDSMPGEVQP